MWACGLAAVGCKRWCSGAVEEYEHKSFVKHREAFARGKRGPPSGRGLADRYLPSDLADGDFHSTASLSCTTGSLACKEGRSLFYGSGKQRIPLSLSLPSEAIWARQMTVVALTVTALRERPALGLATPRAVCPCLIDIVGWMDCVL